MAGRLAGESEFHNSLYFRENQKILECPFCGHPMRFMWILDRAGIGRWQCEKCDCIVHDRVSYDDTEFREIRLEHLKRLRSTVRSLGEQYEEAHKKLKMYGHHIKDKRILLGDRIEIEPEDESDY